MASIIFYFHPYLWKRFPFWRAYFSKGVGSTTNQIWISNMMVVGRWCQTVLSKTGLFFFWWSSATKFFFFSLSIHENEMGLILRGTPDSNPKPPGPTDYCTRCIACSSLLFFFEWFLFCFFNFEHKIEYLYFLLYLFNMNGDCCEGFHIQQKRCHPATWPQPRTIRAKMNFNSPAKFWPTILK